MDCCVRARWRLDGYGSCGAESRVWVCKGSAGKGREWFGSQVVERCVVDGSGSVWMVAECYGSRGKVRNVTDGTGMAVMERSG